ncbi:alpha-L-fucosidase [Puia sp. P3]|uniref:alpha-L-fucosidase n=1 Tax=Puia sp. P3 TaxID=3423952 RepID=UPI003D6679B9
METCQTFSGSWGYYRDENSWKTDHKLLDLLITSTANGGNLILNVGADCLAGNLTTGRRVRWTVFPCGCMPTARLFIIVLMRRRSSRRRRIRV